VVTGGQRHHGIVLTSHPILLDSCTRLSQVALFIIDSSLSQGSTIAVDVKDGSPSHSKTNSLPHTHLFTHARAHTQARRSVSVSFEIFVFLAWPLSPRHKEQRVHTLPLTPSAPRPCFLSPLCPHPFLSTFIYSCRHFLLASLLMHSGKLSYTITKTEIPDDADADMSPVVGA
jgi:hypothetical protein